MNELTQVSLLFYIFINKTQLMCIYCYTIIRIITWSWEWDKWCGIILWNIKKNKKLLLQKFIPLRFYGENIISSLSLKLVCAL